MVINEAAASDGKIDKTKPLTEKQVGHVLDRMGTTGPLKILVFAASLGYLFDAFDNALLGYVLPAISEEFTIDPVIKGLIISAALWGGVLGQYVWGPLADIRGRRPAFQGTLLSFSGFTGLTALSWNPISLFVFRFITGTGLAGFIPVDSAMVSEMTPTRIRGRLTSFLPVVFPLGSLMAAGITLALLDVIGWRFMFVIGALPALIAFWVRHNLPESPRWLAVKGRGIEAIAALQKLAAPDHLIAEAQQLPDEEQRVAETKANFRELLTARWVKAHIVSWSLWISVNFAYMGVLLWLPSILVDVYGFSIAKSLTMTLITNSVGVAGRLFGVFLIERIGRKPLIIYTYVCAALICLTIGFLDNPNIFIVLMAIFFFFADQASVGVVAFVPELYPTRLRVLGSAWAAAAGRIASAVSPIMAGAFMKFNAFAAVWIVFAAVYVVAALITWFLAPETKGRSLDDVTDANIEASGAGGEPPLQNA